MKLYYSPYSCSLAVQILLEEIGQPYELELVQAGAGTQTAEWRQVNPKGRVPALAPVPGNSGGARDLLTEVTAIMVHLAQTKPDLGLLPKDPVAFARMLEWMNWLATLHAGVYATITRPHRFTADEAAWPGLKDKGLAGMAENFAYIESLMADGRTFAAGDSYSIADIYLFLFWIWGNRHILAFEMRETYPAWTRHADLLLARPAVRRALEQNGPTRL